MLLRWAALQLLNSRPNLLSAFASLALLTAACADSSDNSATTDTAALSGGEATVFDATSKAFAQPHPISASHHSACISPVTRRSTPPLSLPPHR
jgi:hypothetical protein